MFIRNGIKSILRERGRTAAKALSDEDILAVEGVTAWHRGNTTFASVEGFERSNS